MLALARRAVLRSAPAAVGGARRASPHLCLFPRFAAASGSAAAGVVDALRRLNRSRNNGELLRFWDKHVGVTPATGIDAVGDDALTVYLAAVHRARDARFDEWHSALLQQKTARAYGVLLSVYCYRDMSSRARMVLEAWVNQLQTLQQAGSSTAELGLTLTACQGVLGWIARRGMWREASRVISAMEKGQATAEDVASTMFEDAANSERGTGEVAQMMAHLRTLLTAGPLPAPDEQCYRRALRASLHAGQITEAVEMFENMKSRGIKPSPATAGTMLLVYKSKDVDPRYLLVFHAAITGQLETAEGVHFEKHHTEVLDTCGLTVEEMRDENFAGRCAVALAQRGYIQQSFELADRLDKSSAGMLKIVYSSMLKTLIDAKLWSDAYEVFKRLRSSEIQLDAALHEQVTRVLAENKRWHLLSEITKNQVPKHKLVRELDNR